MADFQYTRVLSHGQITDLSGGYRADYPFSIYLRPKEGVEYADDVGPRRDTAGRVRCLLGSRKP